MTGNLMQVADTKVILTGGALAMNIYWQVAGNVKFMEGHRCTHHGGNPFGHDRRDSSKNPYSRIRRAKGVVLVEGRNLNFRLCKPMTLYPPFQNKTFKSQYSSPTYRILHSDQNSESSVRCFVTLGYLTNEESFKSFGRDDPAAKYL
jgi:hypothetical protein